MAGTNIHSQITDEDEIHVPKGFTEAPNATAPIKNESGLLEYRSLEELGSVGPAGPQGPDSEAIENVVIVQKNPGPNQYSDPITAMAAITDSSNSNRYVLKIGPGIYQLSAPLVLKEGVTVRPDGHSTVILEPANPLNDIVQISTPDCRIQGMTLRGATGANAAGIRVTDLQSLTVIVDVMTIVNCTTGVSVESTTEDVQAVFRNLGISAGSTTKRLLNIQSTGGFESVVRIYSAILTDNDGTVFEDGILLSGAGARLDGNTLLIRSSTSTGNGIRVNNGGEFVSQAGAEIEGFNKNLYAENSGSAPIIRTNTIMLRNAATNSLHIEHPGTLGALMAKAGVDTNGEVLVNDNAPIKLFITDSDSNHPTSILVKGDIVQADQFSRPVNISKLGRAASTMGLFSGGVLSDGGGLNVSVAAGNGFLTDPVEGYLREISWEADTLTINAGSSRYIFVNSNSVVSQSASLPSLSDTIILGRVSTLDASIHIIQKTPMRINQFGNRVSEMQREAFGAIYSFGSLVAENASTDRALDIGSGSYWFSTNHFIPTGGAALEFSEFYRKTVSGFNIITGATQVSNTNYDDGSGTLASIPTGKLVKHSLYVYGDGADEEYFIVYGQELFDTLVEAEAGNIPAPPSSFDDAVALIASIIVQEGQANIQSILDERPVLGHKSSGIAASANHGNLLGLLADDHPQYFLANGGRALSGDLNMGGNNIAGVGLVDGVDVDSHAARHLPNGADALATAAPVTATADASNNVGIANTLSRSDHKHNIAVADPIAISDSTNSQGASTSLARADHVHSHGNRGGGTLHSAVTTSTDGFMAAADKVILNRLRTGFLQYNNSTLQTNGTATFQALLFQTDINSFANGFFTKASNTDFQANFEGRVEISFDVYFYVANNDRRGQFQLFKNGSAVSGTLRQTAAKADPATGASVSLNWIEPVTINDILQIRFASPDVSTVTIPINTASVRMKIYSNGLT